MVLYCGYLISNPEKSFQLMAYTSSQLGPKATMTLLVPLRNNIRGVGIDFNRIKPRTPSIPRPHRQDPPRQSRVIGEQIIRPYSRKGPYSC